MIYVRIIAFDRLDISFSSSYRSRESDCRSFVRARAGLTTVARSNTVSSLTERISKAKRRSVYRPRTVGVGSAQEWSVCSRSAAWRLRAASLRRALEKIPIARGNGGRSGPGGRRKCSLVGRDRGTSPKGGDPGGRVIYTGSSPTVFVVVVVVAAAPLRLLHRLLFFVPISVSLPRPLSLSFSLFLFLLATVPQSSPFLLSSSLRSYSI